MCNAAGSTVGNMPIAVVNVRRFDRYYTRHRFHNARTPIPRRVASKLDRLSAVTAVARRAAILHKHFG